MTQTLVGIRIYWQAFLESDFCHPPPPPSNLVNQNVLEHLYFDKAQTADLGPIESSETLGNPPCLSAVPK